MGLRRIQKISRFVEPFSRRAIKARPSPLRVFCWPAIKSWKKSIHFCSTLPPEFCHWSTMQMPFSSACSRQNSNRRDLMNFSASFSTLLCVETFFCVLKWKASRTFCHSSCLSSLCVHCLCDFACSRFVSSFERFRSFSTLLLWIFQKVGVTRSRKRRLTSETAGWEAEHRKCELIDVSRFKHPIQNEYLDDFELAKKRDLATKPFSRGSTIYC